MINAERAPMPGTQMANVFLELRRGTPRVALPGRLELERKTVSVTIQNLRRDGFLPRPTADETRNAMSESVAAARGSIWTDIEPYVRVGMRPSETELSLQVTRGIAITEELKSKIATAFGKKTRRGLPLRTPQERRQSRIDTLFETKGERERRVIIWLNRMANTPEKDWPSTRQEWLDPADKIKIDIASLARNPKIQDMQLGQLLPVQSYPARKKLVIKAIDLQEIPLEDLVSLLIHHFWMPNPTNAQQELANLGIMINKRGIYEYENRMEDLVYEHKKFLETLGILEGEAKSKQH